MCLEINLVSLFTIGLIIQLFPWLIDQLNTGQVRCINAIVLPSFSSTRPENHHGRVNLVPFKRDANVSYWYRSVHWTNHIWQGTRNTRPCIIDQITLYRCKQRIFESGGQTFPFPLSLGSGLLKRCSRFLKKLPQWVQWPCGGQKRLFLGSFRFV